MIGHLISEIRENIVVGSGEYRTARGFLDYSGTSTLKNNLFWSRGSHAIISHLDTIINNVIYGDWNRGILGAGSVIENNHIEKTQVGLYYDSGSGVPPPVYKFNNMWDNDVNFQNFTADSTNIFADPMFVNPDSMDFHLQMFSPLIDAGDPNILDKDGSRSDIGLFGGPYGEIYTYRDLAPKPPSNLTAEYDSGLVKLTWNKNTESDFYRYRIYRDTIPNFMYDTTKIIAVVADTFYYDDLPEKYLAGNYYYKLTAMDSTGHHSAPSEEAHKTITGIPEAPPIVVERYQLLNNYPNPFNPSTTIKFSLPEASQVSLKIYNLLGQEIYTIVNSFMEEGFHTVNFNADGLNSGMYLYKLEAGEFSKVKKMTLIK